MSRTPTPETWIPFSNGSEAGDWKSRNCHRCRVGYDEDTGKGESDWRCPLERAMDLACIGDGAMPLAVAEKIGRIEIKTESGSYHRLGPCTVLQEPKQGAETTRDMADRFRACFDVTTRRAWERDTMRGRHDHTRCTGEGYVPEVGLVACPCACHREVKRG